MSATIKVHALMKMQYKRVLFFVYIKDMFVSHDQDSLSNENAVEHYQEPSPL